MKITILLYIFIALLLMLSGFMSGVGYQCERVNGSLLPNMDCVQTDNLDYCLMPDTGQIAFRSQEVIPLNRSLFNWSDAR